METKVKGFVAPIGDRNIKYFNGIVNIHRKFNSLFTVGVEGVRYDTLQDMKSVIFGFYNSLFSKLEPWKPYVDVLYLPLLREVDTEYIEMPFNEDEVIKALLDCCGGKFPKANGMTMTFLQSNWAILSRDVTSMFTEFFSLGKFVASLNTTFISLITLIPKKVDTDNIR